MVQYVFTPWRDRQELLLVRKQFYGALSMSTSTFILGSGGDGDGDGDGDASGLGHGSSGRGRRLTTGPRHSYGGEQRQQRQTRGEEGPKDEKDEEENDDELREGRLTQGAADDSSHSLRRWDDGDGQTQQQRQQQQQQQHQAVARVSMWMQRGNCPHMVESTALLMAAVLNDKAMATENAGASTYAVRAAYSAAFSRFVTGLLDSHQDKLRKQSMHSIAKTIGLPATFVELRHQATHEQLPSLAKLRSAAGKALTWIWDYYWKQLGEEEEKRDPCRELVLSYLRQDDEPARQRILKQLRRWDLDQVLKTIGELQKTLPGNQVFLKCLKLSKEVTALVAEEAPKGSEAGEEGTETETETQTGPSAEERRSDGSPEPSQEPEPDIGWSRYSGAWKPKPIGTV